VLRHFGDLRAGIDPRFIGLDDEPDDEVRIMRFPTARRTGGN